MTTRDTQPEANEPSRDVEFDISVEPPAAHESTIPAKPPVAGPYPGGVEAFFAELEAGEEAAVAAKKAGRAPRVHDQPDADARQHPWPPVSVGRRHEAIIQAAGWCRQRTLPLHHALLLIQDWNAHNSIPEETVEVGKQVSDVYARYEDGPAVPEPQYIRLSDHRSIVPIDREWLIPKFLPAKSRCAISGSPGGGKSFLAHEAASAVGYGTKFLGETLCAFRGNVVLLDGEGGLVRAVNRNNALLNGSGLDPEGEFGIYWRSAAGLTLSAGGSIDALAEGLARFEPVLIIFDTLAKVMGLQDENSNGAVAKVTSAMYALNQALGATLLFISHPAKNAVGDSIRGAGELSADLDVLWTVRGEGGGKDQLRHAKCGKDRDGDLEGKSFAFRIKDLDTGCTILRAEDVEPSAADADGPAMSPTARRVMALVSEKPGIGTSELYRRVMAASSVGRNAVYTATRGLLQRGVITCQDRCWSLAE